MKDKFNIRGLLILALVVIVFVELFRAVTPMMAENKPVPYSEFLTQMTEGKVTEATIEGNAIEGFDISYKQGSDSKVYSTFTAYDAQLNDKFTENNVKFLVKKTEGPSFLERFLVSWLPILLMVAVAIFFFRQMQGGGKGGAFSFGKSKAKMLEESANPITFADVAGCDEAKEEVGEIVEFLRDPTKFQKLGGHIPRGILMVGSPGTGKTLLAKAIAGEAKVPFFSVSGSDFVEMFVGVGASRVRDMFEQAKRSAPCIIFIDEIDAVGRHRGSGTGGGNDEREQTLNQMLVEMDGFEPSAGVIVIAATNRADVLDKALLRPGRFDRQVVVPLPDIRGREQILAVHTKKIPAANDIQLSVLARGTPGFSGADLANLVNEAALFAARRNKQLVDMQDFEDAKDKIYMGPERRSMVMSEDERRATAYHESGHAVVAYLLPFSDPVHKVTIMPRGRALGLTWQLPERDRISVYQDQMLTQLAILFAGRVAEDVFIGRISTGASNDYERATHIARDMVMRFGMSTKLGAMVYADDEQETMFGRMNGNNHLSEATKQLVDAEIRQILDTQYALAEKILAENRDKVEAMTKALMEWETIDAVQIKAIMDGLDPVPPLVIPVRPSHSSQPPAPPAEKDTASTVPVQPAQL